jgi:DNA-binding response OmpR family regulator
VAILHVDDHEAIREVVRRALEAVGIAVVSAEGVRAAELALVERDDVTGAMLDVRLRDGSGLDVYRWMVLHRPARATRVAFVTGSADTIEMGPVLTLGCPIIRKPFELSDVRRLAVEWEEAVDPGRLARTRGS